MDLRVVISRILAGTAVFGAGVACSCPPTAPSFMVQGSESLPELLGEVVDDRESANCELVCDVLDSTVDGWRCTFSPLVVPTSAECRRSTTDEPEQVDFDEHGVEMLPELWLPQNDCEAICMTTEGWAVAEAAGVEQNAIWCSDLAGETADDLTMNCQFGSECIGGRRPLGKQVHSTIGGAHAGSWWAAMAQLEHISIRAFEELARDLTRLGAPDSLVQRALDAARDERRHAGSCISRARAHGVSVALVDAEPAPPANLETLARHNAREGCVRESFAALEAGWQARHAANPEDRKALAEIHADEVRHGQLAWDIHAWVGDRVDGRAEIEAAFIELGAAAQRSAGWDGRSVGLPSPRVRQALVAALRAAA